MSRNEIRVRSKVKNKNAPRSKVQKSNDFESVFVLWASRVQQPQQQRENLYYQYFRRVLRPIFYLTNFVSWFISLLRNGIPFATAWTSMLACLRLCSQNERDSFGLSSKFNEQYVLHWVFLEQRHEHERERRCEFVINIYFGREEKKTKINDCWKTHRNVILFAMLMDEINIVCAWTKFKFYLCL